MNKKIENKDNIKCSKKNKKKEYRVSNWGEYNKGLKNRGSMTLWITDDIEFIWNGKGRYEYSDKAIEIMITLKNILQLPLRNLEGFVKSIFHMMSINLEVPDYTTLSRRVGKLNININKKEKENTHIIIDSTGLKVFGEGEWKVRKYGVGKRRTWKKMHLGIDENGEIRLMTTSDSNTHDNQKFKELIDQEKSKITDFYGDGAYDGKNIYDELIKLKVDNIHIPPQVKAKIWKNKNKKGPRHPRDNNLRSIRNSTRASWKKKSGYHKRSLVETTMFRFKNTFSGELSFRKDKNQDNEMKIKCNTLNTFLNIAKPQSYVKLK